MRPTVWTRERIDRWKRTGKVPSPVMVWPPDLARQFLAHARRDRLYPLFHLVAVKGLRRGEAVGLPWAETRMRDQAIDVRTLRHGAASLSLAAGVDVKVVSAELGHATTGFTQDTYQNVFPEVARAAAENTAQFLGATEEA